MNDKFIVKVNATHIKKGVCQSPSSCAIALAILDVSKNITTVSVDDDYARLSFKDRIVRYYSTPTRAARFISKFDNRKKVKPTTFIFKFDSSYKSW